MTKDKDKGQPLSKWARDEIAKISDEEDRRITEAALSDPDNPPLTKDWFNKARPAAEVVPDLVEEYRRRVRGKQKAPTKESVTLRLDPDVIEHFRAGGRGWQTRINEALRRTMKRQKRAS